jgi:hypothetical protein
MMDVKKELTDFFEAEKVSIIQYPDTGTFDFSHLGKFFDFIQKERDFWSSCQSGACAEIHNFFNSLHNRLNQVLQPNAEVNNAKNVIRQIINEAKRNSFPAVYSSTSTAFFIKNLFAQNPQMGVAACEYIFKKNVSNLNNVNALEGVLYTLIFTGKVDSAFKSGVEDNRQKLEELRSKFTAELNALHADFDAKSKNIESSIAKYQTEVAEWKVNIQKDTETFLTSKQKTLSDLESSYKSSQGEMERLYKELLRLDGPAQYWSNFSIEHTKQGDRWRTWSVVTSAIFILFLTSILYHLPQEYLTSKGFTFESFKIAVIITLIVSVAIYLIRLFIKLSISSYHLSRDANERYQLTHVFLSLLKEQGVSEAERHIVLQSLFSRADTGLLKGEHSPTIPDSIWSHIFKNIAGK